MYLLLLQARFAKLVQNKRGILTGQQYYPHTLASERKHTITNVRK